MASERPDIRKGLQGVGLTPTSPHTAPAPQHDAAIGRGASEKRGRISCWPHTSPRCLLAPSNRQLKWRWVYAHPHEWRARPPKGWKGVRSQRSVGCQPDSPLSPAPRDLQSNPGGSTSNEGIGLGRRVGWGHPYLGTPDSPRLRSLLLLRGVDRRRTDCCCLLRVPAPLRGEVNPADRLATAVADEIDRTDRECIVVRVSGLQSRSVHRSIGQSSATAHETHTPHAPALAAGACGPMA